MKNIKRRVITWVILTVLAFIAIIALSAFISSLQGVLDINNVKLDSDIIDAYQYAKAYSIGGLAFSCVIFLLGSIISYAGLKSWKYIDMFA
ncbi:hypothetical protein H9M94_03155 [Mycoplasma sp. Pen4]|uniref:hypothetical protein n=1 Tax=Mycoplasma sp. Pen4 TaxID=640330 RepID=UPI0016546B3C|nr:hypothetical protein [Mycoplasma sp. Pen4]QNM93576.1 hypothetical protein H9M94_03155 [Mycoplasma sp. Pen4]